MRKTINIFSIAFAALHKQEIIEKLNIFLSSSQQHHIATPNPEFLLESLKNEEFTKILQNSVLNIPDGIGILWAVTIESKIHKVKKYKNTIYHILYTIYKYAIGLFYLLMILIYPKAVTKIIPERITGTDLMADIFQNFPDKKIFLLGAKEGIAEKAINNLIKKNTLYYIPYTIYQFHSGSPKLSDENKIISKINSFQPDILFVAFGAPAQELWINRNLSNMPSVKIAIGVGGAFDFYAGERKRAPKIFQKLGIEWLFRLIIEPRRWKRIFNATVVFPWKFLKSL